MNTITNSTQPEEYALSQDNASEQYSLTGPSTLPPALTEDVLNLRSAKAAVGLGIPVEEVKTQIASPGGEDRLAEFAARKEVLNKKKERIDLINQALTERDPSKPLSSEEVSFVANLSDKDFADIKHDPHILQQKYAEAAVKSAFANPDNSLYMRSVSSFPEVTDKTHKVAEEIARTKEFTQKLIEDSTDTSYSASSWGKYLFNKGLQMVPFVSDYAKYDKYAGTDWMPGNNMLQQMENLWGLPPIEREQKIQDKFSEIKNVNPEDARDWARNVLSFSTTDAAWSNAMTAVDVASTIPIGMVGKAIKGGSVAVKGVSEAAKVSEAAVKTVSPFEKSLEGLGKTQLKSLEDGLSAKMRSAMFSRDNKTLIEQRNAVRTKLQGLTEVEVQKNAKDAVKALNPENVDVVKIAADTGQVDKAAELATRKEFAKEFDPTVAGTEAQQMADKLNSTSSVFNASKFLADSPNLAAEAANRLIDASIARRATYQKILDNPHAAQRMTQEQVDLAIENTKEALKKLPYNSENAIMDFTFTDQTKVEDQLNYVSMWIGKDGATPFDTAEEATQMALNKHGIKPEDFTVSQQGQGFAIKVSRPVDENDVTLLSPRLATEYTQTPKSLANTFLGRFRTPEDLLSRQSRDNRNIIVPSSQQHVKLFQDAVAPSLEAMSKKERKNLEMFTSQMERDFQEQGVRGRFMQSSAEFEQRYHDMFKEYPKERVINAYMALRDLSDFDLSVRSLALKRDKASRGIVNITGAHEMRIPPQGEVTDLVDGGEASLYKKTDVRFEGKEIESLPEATDRDNPGVYIQSRAYDGSHSLEWKSLKSVDRAELKKMTEEQGYKIYQAADAHSAAFADVTGDKTPASFYIMKGASTSNLRAADMIPFKAGYHVEYPDGFYTKVPTFFHNPEGVKYNGSDIAISHHVTEAAAKKYVSLMNRARELLRDGNEEAFNAFVTKHLPHTPVEFKQIYSAKGADINTPFMYTRQGMSTAEAATGHMGVHADMFKDAQNLSDSKYNMLGSWGVNRKFTQEKDLALPTIRDQGELKPVFDFSPSQNISIFSTYQRQMHSLVKMRVYDNYVKQAVSSFIQEFAVKETAGGSMTKWSPEMILKNPLSFIADPRWDKSVLDKGKLSAAMNVHRSVQTLLHSPSDFTRNVDWLMNKIASSSYERFGEDFAQKVSDFGHFSMSDPAKYARSIAFHAKLGLFNPIHLFIQSQGVFHTAALTGNLARSYQSAAGSLFMRYLNLTDNPNIINAFAKKASAFGWNAEDFKEANELMRTIGIHNVEGDVAQIDDAFAGNLMSTKRNKVLHAGTVFFREGERFVRVNAFNTAYLEWKEANKGAKLLGNERAINSIMTRYDDLALNMTHKSTAAIQRGVFSLPLQFSTYTFHIAEQMLGKRLTSAEKLRAMTMYSTLYGLPAGVTAAVPIYDWNKEMKEAALSRNIDLNSGALDLISHGILATGIEAVTGKQTSANERWGPNSLSFVRDWMTGKKSGMEIMFGPSGQMTKDAFNAVLKIASPVLGAVADAGRDSNDTFPITGQDFIQSLRNISSVDNAVKLYVAANQHKYMNKNGVVFSDADAVDGILGGILGAEPRAISDSYVKQEMLSNIRKYKQDATKEVILNLQRAFDNGESPTTMSMYLKAAKLSAINGGLTPQDYMNAARQAVTDKYMTKIEQTDKFWQRQQNQSTLSDLYTKQGTQ